MRNLFPGVPAPQSATLYPWSVGLTINPALFNGFKTANTVRQSEAQVRSGREMLRNVEQSVLLDAVTAYMDVLSFQTLVEAQRVNVTFLRGDDGNHPPTPGCRRRHADGSCASRSAHQPRPR